MKVRCGLMVIVGSIAVGCASLPAGSIALVGAPDPAAAVGAISPDGTMVAIGGLKTVVYDVANPAAGRELSACGQTRHIAFSPDSTKLACAGQGFVVVDAKTGAKLHSDGGDEYGAAVAFNPSGSLLVVGGGELTAYDTSTWEVKQKLEGADVGYTGAGFVDDNQVVVTCDMGKRIVVWDVAKNEKLYDEETFNRLDMDRTGRIHVGKNRVMFASKIMTQVYDLEDELDHKPLDLEYMKELQDYEAKTASALSADGMVFARDNLIFDYIEGEVETPTIRNRAKLRGEVGAGRVLAFSADGQKVLIGEPGAGEAYLVPLADLL